MLWFILGWHVDCVWERGKSLTEEGFVLELRCAVRVL